MKKKVYFQDLSNFENIIGYHFKNKELLTRAFTHSSFANEHKKQEIKNNERLEFLGDSVLSLVISEYIFSSFPELPEGELTKLRATVVCETSLAKSAREMQVGSFIHLGKGEEMTGGRNRDSILSDAFEAILGAMYLDGGFEVARKHVLKYLENTLNEAKEGKIFNDYKTCLQELLQQHSYEKIEYSIIKEQGPDHNKEFFVQVMHGSKVLGTGWGRSKKEAEQHAAQNALETLVQ